MQFSLGVILQLTARLALPWRAQRYFGAVGHWGRDSRISRRRFEIAILPVRFALAEAQGYSF
jgi:hypothetical protein